MPFVFLRPDFLLLRRAFSETPPPFPMKTSPGRKKEAARESLGPFCVCSILNIAVKETGNRRSRRALPLPLSLLVSALVYVFPRGDSSTTYCAT